MLGDGGTGAAVAGGNRIIITRRRIVRVIVMVIVTVVVSIVAMTIIIIIIMICRGDRFRVTRRCQQSAQQPNSLHSLYEEITRLAETSLAQHNLNDLDITSITLTHISIP